MFDGKSRYTFRYEVIVARESTQTVFTTVFHTARESKVVAITAIGGLSTHKVQQREVFFENKVFSITVT